LGNRVVGLSFGGGQDDLAAQGNLPGRAEGSAPLLQLLSLSFLQGQGGQSTWHEDNIMQESLVSKLFIGQIAYLFTGHYTRMWFS
jgi:hypothetical protein